MIQQAVRHVMTGRARSTAPENRRRPKTKQVRIARGVHVQLLSKHTDAELTEDGDPNLVIWYARVLEEKPGACIGSHWFLTEDEIQ